MRITSQGKPSAFDLADEIQVPLVVVEKLINNENVFVGFVPGITLEDIFSKDLEECKKMLTDKATAEILNMLKNNSAFPFFPTQDEIMEDFENVQYIEFLNIKK